MSVKVYCMFCQGTFRPGTTRKLSIESFVNQNQTNMSEDELQQYYSGPVNVPRVIIILEIIKLSLVWDVRISFYLDAFWYNNIISSVHFEEMVNLR